jgi:hypothetical protein
MRVSRQWRNLVDLKRAGLAHDPSLKYKSGGLAVFCPSCPQPGINVSIDEIRSSETPYVILYECSHMLILFLIQLGILPQDCC